MALNSSGHVLVKIVEKLRGQHLHTARGPGPTLLEHHHAVLVSVQFDILSQVRWTKREAFYTYDFIHEK